MFGHLLEAQQVGLPRTLDAALADYAVVDQLDTISLVCVEQAAPRNVPQRALLKKGKGKNGMGEGGQGKGEVGKGTSRGRNTGEERDVRGVNGERGDGVLTYLPCAGRCARRRPARGAHSQLWRRPRAATPPYPQRTSACAAPVSGRCGVYSRG